MRRGTTVRKTVEGENKELLKEKVKKTRQPERMKNNERE